VLYPWGRRRRDGQLGAARAHATLTQEPSDPRNRGESHKPRNHADGRDVEAEVNIIVRRGAALIVPVLAAAHLGAGPRPVEASAPAGEPVPFESLAIVSGTTGINLAEGHILRVASPDDIEPVAALLDAGPYDDTMADEVVEAIGAVPPGTVVLIGVIDQSCTPAKVAGLVRGPDGELAMFAPGHVPEPVECFVANITVGVLSVAADEAPPGSADGAQLVDFRSVGSTPPSSGATAVDLTDDPDRLAMLLPADAEVPALPDVAKGNRRIAFVQSGCQLASAELWTGRVVITAHFEQADPSVEVVCEIAEYYLAVFDIAADLLPPNVEVDGSIVA
jgi:hypothetical protein